MPTLGDDINDFLDPILATFSDELEAAIYLGLVTAYLRGSSQMTSWGRIKITAKLGISDTPPMQDAINYASKHISKAKLVDGITKEFKGRLSEIISDGVKNKRGIPGIARDLRNELRWSTKARSDIRGLTLKARSEMIARTETADALEQSFMDRSLDMGVTGKEWVVTEPCEICQANEGVIIPINDVFPSGHLRPPAHPRCRCALAPVMLED